METKIIELEHDLNELLAGLSAVDSYEDYQAILKTIREIEEEIEQCHQN